MVSYLCSSIWPATGSLQSVTSRLSLDSLLNAIYGQTRLYVIYLGVIFLHAICARRNNDLHDPRCCYPYSLTLPIYVYVCMYKYKYKSVCICIYQLPVFTIETECFVLCEAK
jgi:hypothetical protein